MLKRFQGWQGIAALFISCISTTVFAQLPATKPSPLNQIGRAWGFGFSDGYHECPECQRPSSPSKLGAVPVTVSHKTPCVQCEQKTSFFTKWNPFKDSSAAGHSPSCGPGGNPAMTVLPPSPQMYQQFAAPSESPLPGSSVQPSAPNSISNQTFSNQPLSSDVSDGIAPENFPASPGSPVPDPIEFGSQTDQAQRNGTSPMPPQDTVPPPPVLRKRQKGDKPLGEEESKNTPREPVKPEQLDKDKTGPDKSDDSLDLLPKDDPPPITVHPQSRGGRSLISHTIPTREALPFSPPMDPHEAMLKQYYGRAYSRQELPDSTPESVVEKGSPRPFPSNRYRFR